MFERYYQILETGLALGGGGCYRKDFGLASRLEQEWKTATGTKDVSLYGNLFDDVAARVGKPSGVPWIELDEGLVTRARGGLSRANLAVRAYQRVVNALTLPSAPALNLGVTRVSRLDGLYREEACRAYRDALSNARFEGDRDCVLNMELPYQARDPDALWNQYSSRYLLFWQDWLNHWELRDPPRSLAEVSVVLANLSNTRDSDIVDVLRQVGGVDNRTLSLPGGTDVSLPPGSSACRALVARFLPYPTMVDPNAKEAGPAAEALKDLMAALDLLRLKLAELTEDPTAVQPVLALVQSTANGDSELTRAIDLARKFEQSAGEGSPLAAGRVRAIVQEVVQGAWTLVRSRAQRHLETTWRRDVWARWRDVGSRYPFTPGAPNVVSCAEVEAVVGGGDSLLSRFIDTELGRFVVDSRAGRLEAKRGRLGPALLFSTDFVEAVERIRQSFARANCVSDPPGSVRPQLAPGSRSNRVSAVRFESAGTCWSFRMSSRAGAECTALRDGVTLGVVVGSGPRATSETLYHFEGPWAFERLLEAAETELRDRRSFCWKVDATQQPVGWEATIWLEFPVKVFEGRMGVDVLRRIRVPEEIFIGNGTGK